MSGHTKCHKSVPNRTVIMCSEGSSTKTFLLTTILLIFNLPTSDAGVGCSFNGYGDCLIGTNTSRYLEELLEVNQTIQWNIRPQNIGFMYYLRTSDDGSDLSVKGIVRWKVHLKNWTLNDTALEGYLITILDHDTNATVTSYEITVTEPFDKFLNRSEVMEVRLELDNVLQFDRRYDARINLLPIGKQAAASSFISVMSKLDGEPCSEKKGLAERWAPHVMVDVFETTSLVELTWLPAPSFLCIKTYEVVLTNRDGEILNTTEIEVDPEQKIATAEFGKLFKNQSLHVKVRGKNSIDGGCACVNCNCITDKTRWFVIPDGEKKTPLLTTTSISLHPIHPSESLLGIPFLTVLLPVFAFICVILCCCVCCRKYNIVARLKQRVAFDIHTTPEISKKKQKPRKCFQVLLVCPEVSGRDYDWMVRIADALKNSSNKVACDRWKECFPEAEENIIHWVYEQTKIAEKIIVFHSAENHPKNGVYNLINTYFPSTDPRIAHIALSSEVQRNFPREVEYVMPRDQKLLEEAYDISISKPLVIDIPKSIVMDPNFNRASCESIEDGSPDSTKTHSTDSGVSSMSSESGGSNEGLPEKTKAKEPTTVVEIELEVVQQVPETETETQNQTEIELHPLLMRPITV